MDTSLESGFSNFLFIDRRYQSQPVLRRIFSLARVLGFQSLLIEELREADCPLLAAENDALRIRRTDYSRSITHRLTFWRCAPEQASAPTDFVGYAVCKMDYFSGRNDPVGHVYEAVLPPVRQAEQNNFVHCLRSYRVQTTAGEQAVTGVLYAQQNDLTFVCAHVALRTALSCLLPDADISYARMNALAGVDHQTRTVGGGAGLSPEDMERILVGVGVPYKKVVHEPQRGLDLPGEFQKDLYGFIESGNPALVGFELEDPRAGPAGQARHIVPVVGHTFNEDAWVPDAQRTYFGNQLRYFSSESWLSSYLLHDDNFGPYYCLPRHFLRKDNFRIILGLERFASSYSAGDAEAVGFDFFRAFASATPSIGQDWYDRFTIFAKSGLLVLRSLLVTREKYVQHLRQIRDRSDASLEADLVQQLENRLPAFFWMIEASAQELFTVSRRKFGEVLLSSTIALPRPLDLTVFLGARLPGMVFQPEVGGLKPSTTRLSGHVPLFSGT